MASFLWLGTGLSKAEKAKAERKKERDRENIKSKRMGENEKKERQKKSLKARRAAEKADSQYPCKEHDDLVKAEIDRKFPQVDQR